MARRAQAIARVRLARSLPRLLAAPGLVIVLAGIAAAAGLLLVGGVPGLAIAAGAGVVALLAILAAAALLSVRVDVEESLVRLRWLFGRRVYLLTPGSLTRVHLRGEGASRLRPRFGLGWALGPARLRDEEEIHIVRLAPTPSVILVPTARGRLAIATSNEQHLIEVLTQAAQARARVEELAEADAEDVDLPMPVAQPDAGEPDPRLMTGIERSTTAAAPSPRRIFRRPSWARRRPGAPSTAGASMSLPALPSVSMPSVPHRVRALPIGRPRPSWIVPLLPLIAAGAVWGAGVYLDRIPLTGSSTARLTVLALILSGPATTIGAIMARTWWPRLVAVVVLGGLASSVFIVRALLAG